MFLFEKVKVKLAKKFGPGSAAMKKAGNYSITGANLKAASDNNIYPEYALKAALDLRTFSNFRQNPHYTPILEHVRKNEALAYLDLIRNTHGMSARDILEIIEPLQHIGNPKKVMLDGLDIPVSTTALRYLHVALDIRKQCGDRVPVVAEIGCGYGGQAVILSRLIDMDKYYFLDLWQVNMLIQRFIESVDINFAYETLTLKQMEKEIRSDLIISNYAFSELPRKIQQPYFDKVLKSSAHGYMTMNSGTKGIYSGVVGFGQKELQSMIKGAVVTEEKPKTSSDNYIISW